MCDWVSLLHLPFYCRTSPLSAVPGKVPGSIRASCSSWVNYGQSMAFLNSESLSEVGDLILWYENLEKEPGTQEGAGPGVCPGLCVTLARALHYIGVFRVQWEQGLKLWRYALRIILGEGQ